MSEPYTPSVAPNSALPVGHNELVSDAGQISDFRTLLRTLSADALTRGKQFERVTKWWLENDPIHSRQIEKVWLWDEWPEYPGRDIGIDLVVKLLDGSLFVDPYPESLKQLPSIFIDPKDHYGEG
jgi:hypothetical protein